MTTHFPVLVIGGGISGLTCAYALRKSGIDAHLLESSLHPGGVIRSERRDGYLLELGPQSFSGTPALRQLFRNLDIESQIVQAPQKAPRYLLIDGKLQPAPLSPPAFFASPLFNASTKWSVPRDLFGHSSPPANDESVAAFTRRKFSAQLLDRLVGPFVSGIYAGDPERLSLRSAFPQLYEAEKSSGSIIRGMRRASKQQPGPREKPQLLSFREGNETLIRALAKNLGDALHLGAACKTIEHSVPSSPSQPQNYLVSFEEAGQLAQFSTDHLILATPANISGQLLHSSDAALENLLGGIEYAPIAIVSLGYATSSIGRSLDGFGFLIPRSSGLRTLGTVWNSSLFPGRAPTGHALLTSFGGGALDPRALHLDPQSLAALVHKEISPLLSITQQPSFSHVQLYQSAIPQYNLGHAERLKAISDSLAVLPGIHLAGNYLRGPSIGACVAESLALADDVQKAMPQ